MALNLTQRSFKVIHFGGNRKTVYRPLIVGLTLALSSTVSEILPILYSPSQLYKYVNKYVSAPAHKHLAIMHPATHHGVGVITKLHFTIFSAFNE